MKNAQEKLYASIRPLILYWANHLCYPNQDKQELINEAWPYIQKHAKQYGKHASSGVRWAILSAQRTIHGTRRKCRPTIVSLMPESDCPVDDKSLMYTGNRESFLYKLKGLNRNERRVLYGKYWLNLSQSDIGREMNLSKQMVSYYHRKAIKKLKLWHKKAWFLEK